MDLYNNILIDCFKKAKDIDYFDYNSKEDLSLFLAWIIELKEAGQDFLDMLNYLNINYYKTNKAVEFHKGYYDSLVKKYDTQIITPYKQSFIQPNSKKIIHGKLHIMQDTPMYHEYNGNVIIQNLDNTIDTLFTHNFDNPKELAKWANLNPKYNQIIGVYGTVFDKDMIEKISLLKSIHDNNLGFYNEHYNTINNNYLYVINHNSDKRIKKLYE